MRYLCLQEREQSRYKNGFDPWRLSGGSEEGFLSGCMNIWLVQEDDKIF